MASGITAAVINAARRLPNNKNNTATTSIAPSRRFLLTVAMALSTSAVRSYTEVATRAICAHDAGLKVILCIGETEQEHAMGKTKEVCIAQLIALNFATRQSLLLDTVIAYEPVWAIGTGQSATPEQAEEVHSTIRSWIRETVGDHLADTTRIIYGGSVKSDNCKVLIACDNIDGFLIGGASLTEEFATIINKIK